MKKLLTTRSILIPLLLSIVMLGTFMIMQNSKVYAKEGWNNSTEPWNFTIATDKAIYNENDDIGFCVEGFANTGKGADTIWLGLYNKTGDYTTSIKWEYINGDFESTLQSFLELTTIPGGQYHLIATTGSDGNNTDAIWATLDFTITGNEPAPTYDDYYLELNAPYAGKQWGEYMTEGGFCQNTHVYIKAAAPSESGAWVGIYQADATTYPNNNFGWAGITCTSLSDENAQIDYADPEMVTNLNPAYLDGGCYKAILFADGGYTPAKTVYFFIQGGHIYASPTYEWSSDNSYVTATRECTGCDKVETETVSTTSTTTATCTVDGTKTFTAAFENASFTTQTKEVDDPAKGHTWGTPSYTWAEDHKSCDALRKCSACENEETETTTQIGYILNDPSTCTTKGSETYTATFTNSAFSEQTVNVELPLNPEAHLYGTPVYEWSDDYSVCTGTAVCQNDSEHVLKEEAMGSMVSMKPASCSEEGSKNYEANFSDSIFEKQTNTEILPKLEHELDYENGTITKAPTADEDGEWELTCKVCKDTVKKPLDKITYASILIDKLPKAEDLKLEDEDAVKEARTAYDMLTEEQQAEFKETLEAAEAKIAELKKASEDAAKDAAKEAATPVLDEAKAIKNEDGKYTEDSYKALTDAVAVLESELAKEDATAESINSAAQAVKDAISGLKEAEKKPDEGGDEQKPDEGGEIPGASEEAQKQEAISEAKSALNSANDIKAEDYTADSYNAFKEAKEALEKAIEEATSAKEIKDALNKFNEAKASLVKQSSDTKPADGDVPSDGSQGGDSVTPSDTAYAVGTEVTSGGHKYVVTGATTVALKKAKNAKKVTVPASVKLSDGKTYKVTQVNAKAFTGKKIKTVTIGKNVKKLAKNAFKSSKATKMILKTKLLKKASVKGSLKGSKIKTVQVKVGSKKVNKKYVKKYKKIFTKKNAGKKVKVK